MSVQIVLENPRSFYSNLDFIEGRVILSLNKDENVSAILVKLEGESRSALMRPVNVNRPRERSTVEMENHKVLYKVAQVFPSEQQLGPGARPQAYTVGAGKHEYPFRFKIPFNNSCSNTEIPMVGMGFSGMGLSSMQQLHYRHVRRTLPPSLTGYPDMADIRYYVKVTVQRPSLFKENRRSAVGFRFLPIEPPRPPRSTNEVFARRKYEFQPGGLRQKTGMFNKKMVTGSLMPPMGEVEARLPSPAIVTCNEPMPLRIILRNLNESPDQLFLTTLQINLIGSTDIRAHDVARTETNMWAIMTLQALAIPIGKPGDKIRTETILDSTLWDSLPLPNTVAPSFHTCNLSRRYELEVIVVLGYGSGAGAIQVIFHLHISTGSQILIRILATNYLTTSPFPNRGLLWYLSTPSSPQCHCIQAHRFRPSPTDCTPCSWTPYSSSTPFCCCSCRCFCARTSSATNI